MKTMLMTLALALCTLALSALPAQANDRDDGGWQRRDRAPARVVVVEPRHQRRHREVVVCRPRFSYFGPFLTQSVMFSGNWGRVCFVTRDRDRW
jgi:hypothetical protein